MIRTGSGTRPTTGITANPYARQMQAPQTSGTARVASLQRGQQFYIPICWLLPARNMDKYVHKSRYCLQL